MINTKIELKNVNVNIPVVSPGQERLIKKPSLRSSVGGRVSASNKKIVVKALKDITVSIEHGDRLALIGHNGAGKSTLLRVISSIIPVTSGHLQVTGSIGCILDIGIGAQPEMTGLEYIRYFSLLQNHDVKDTIEFCNEIIEFTELSSFINFPLRTYSEGMKARLMAATATSGLHDILLVDEGIGAGDAYFQNKFAVRLESFFERAGILIISSHANEFLKRWCNRGLVLKHGQLEFYGDIDAALEFYSKHP